jgi:hypothetical protein
MKESYIIIKKVENSRGVTVPIIMLNGLSEVMEFDDYDSANKMAQLFEVNSDSGWKYTIRKISGNTIN